MRLAVLLLVILMTSCIPSQAIVQARESVVINRAHEADTTCLDCGCEQARHPRDPSPVRARMMASEPCSVAGCRCPAFRPLSSEAREIAQDNADAWEAQRYLLTGEPMSPEAEARHQARTSGS